jgi:hypothetical protein
MDTLPNRVSHCLPPHPPQRSRNKVMSAAFTHPRQCARGPLTGAGFSAAWCVTALASETTLPVAVSPDFRSS